jgi:hypothetical protein
MIGIYALGLLMSEGCLDQSFKSCEIEVVIVFVYGKMTRGGECVRAIGEVQSQKAALCFFYVEAVVARTKSVPIVLGRSGPDSDRVGTGWVSRGFEERRKGWRLWEVVRPEVVCSEFVDLPAVALKGVFVWAAEIGGCRGRRSREDAHSRRGRV